jgi:hypothetical protein
MISFTITIPFPEPKTQSCYQERRVEEKPKCHFSFFICKNPEDQKYITFKKQK